MNNLNDMLKIIISPESELLSWWRNLNLESFGESDEMYFLGMLSVLDSLNNFIKGIDKNDTSLDDLYLGCTVNEIKIEALEDFLESFTDKAKNSYNIFKIANKQKHEGKLRVLTDERKKL